MPRRLHKASTFPFDNGELLGSFSVRKLNDVSWWTSHDTFVYVSTTTRRLGVRFCERKVDFRNPTFRAWIQHVGGNLAVSYGTCPGVPAVALGHSLGG